jgi:hypothetical protein
MGFIFSCIFFLGLILYFLSRHLVSAKGFSLQDGYISGIFIYSFGVLVLSYSGMVDQLELSKMGVFCSFALFSALIGYFCSNIFLGFKAKKPELLISNRTIKFEFIITSLTLILVLLNFLFIYLVYKRILQGHFGGVFALLDIRKTISSGEAGYFAPGLVKQLRDILAPTLIFYLIVFYQGNFKRFSIIILLASTFGAMLIGGQRMPLLILFLVVFIAYTTRNNIVGKKLPLKLKLGLPILGLIAVFALNILLGRSDSDKSVFLSIVLLVLGMVERVVTVVPHENAAAFNFLTDLNFKPFSLWLADLSILLPGTQKGLSNQIHSMLGGSEAGNSVLGLPLDIYLNSGYLGLILIPFVTVFSLSIMDRIIIRLNSPFLYSSKLVVSIYLPFAYSIYLFLLNGGIFIIAGMIGFLLLATLKRVHVN